MLYWFIRWFDWIFTQCAVSIVKLVAGNCQLPTGDGRSVEFFVDFGGLSTN